MKWENFKKCVKQCREDSAILHGFSTWRELQVFDNSDIRGTKVFFLDPYAVDLRCGSYGPARDLISGSYFDIENLKKLVEDM